RPVSVCTIAGARTGFVQLFLWDAAASAAGLSRAAETWTRVSVGRGLLVSLQRALGLARCLLDASAVSRFILGGTLLGTRPLLRRILVHAARSLRPRPSMGSRARARQGSRVARASRSR